MLTATLLVLALISCNGMVSASPALGHLDISREVFASGEYKFRSCGNHLYKLMSLVCSHSDAVENKSVLGELVLLDEEEWLLLNKDDDSELNSEEIEKKVDIFRRSRRDEIVHSCCKKACTLRTVVSYCPVFKRK
ncbi:uncharacterized protein LOC111053538 [Nilaparvata lugens]|uniref:uncharacterized protein LOC111053538 n=1 Tax=Nilaparvata lugens TaxID=108931 RepID=UPI00193C963B|nr:uncharacterized protein LOC111053538 [Nilaparvata lugens]XP_039294563.1 uncharacterized protein LOC111053538 [Nilaparvata lugens]